MNKFSERKVLLRSLPKLKLSLRYTGAARERIRVWLWPKLKIAPLIKKGGVIAPPPITLSMSPTHLCNLRCRMCGQWRRKDTARREMIALERLKEIIDEVSPFRPKIYIWGGEPLIYPAIWNGEKAQKFRQVLLTRGLFPICSRCCGLYAY